TLDDPLGTLTTCPFGIDGNNIVGFYRDSSDNNTHGFLYNGSTYTTIDDPLAGPGGTYPYGISGNNIVGSYLDSSGNYHGFITTVSQPTSLWASAVSGRWSDSTNWSGVLPNAVGAGAVFSAPTTAALTISLDSPQTVGTLQFGNSGNPGVGYTLSGGGSNTLTLNNSGFGATITVTDGSHVINAPIILANNLVVTT